MKTSLRYLLPMLVAALAVGCLEFAEQTVTFRHDAKTDTLRIFQDYHGIFGADRADGLSEQELEQLDSVLKTERTFFFANWIFEFNRQHFLDDLEELKDPVKRKEKGFGETGAKQLEHLLRTALDSFHVENGPFYLDAKGRLSGVQRVTVTNATKLIAALNDFIPALLRSKADEKDVSPADRTAYLKAADRGGEFVRLSGNSVTLRWPMSRSDHDAMIKENPAALQAFRASGGKFTFADDEITWRVASTFQSTTSLTLPFSDKAYQTNALAAVKARTVIRADFSPSDAAKEFFKAAR